ncbi:MAG: DUF1015 domain-containing protein [Planctomycetes bacterium]|nr:DUF1015 domain-containing protein [Planctomycetota bacterium]
MKMDLRPFRGWHYTGDVSRRIAPPYDILQPSDKAALLDGCADNIVAVDLPHVPPVGVGPDALYDAAAARLKAMKAAGTLVRDDRPALYAYSQTYTWAGRTYTRRAMMCGVRATELYEGVWPHEKTFPGPKADRLKLTEATRMQLSPIFGVFNDPGDVSATLWGAAEGAEPFARGRLRGVDEAIWAVTDPDVIAAVRAAMAEVPVFIADGHHRYTTALNYRNALRDRGAIDDDHEANFVLFTLVPADDPGLLILPTHRLVGGITDGYDCAALMAETADAVEWRSVPLTDALIQTPDEALAAFGPGAMAFLDAGGEQAHVARLADPSVMAALAPDQPQVWRDLDVAILHKLFLEQHILQHAPADTHLGYTARGAEVMEGLASGRYSLAAILRGTPLQSVIDVALARTVMPHKSTFFYPKLATGMVLKPLEA